MGEVNAHACARTNSHCASGAKDTRDARANGPVCARASTSHYVVEVKGERILS